VFGHLALLKGEVAELVVGTICGADGHSYRLRLARTGIHRRQMGAPINHLLNDLSWIKYLLSKERTWTVDVVHRDEWGERTVLEEQFADRDQGATRAEGLIELLLYNAGFGARIRQEHP